MIDNGIVWIDNQYFINQVQKTDDYLYWFPGLMK